MHRACNKFQNFTGQIWAESCLKHAENHGVLVMNCLKQKLTYINQCLRVLTVTNLIDISSTGVRTQKVLGSKFGFKNLRMFKNTVTADGPNENCLPRALDKLWQYFSRR